jgi:transposase
MESIIINDKLNSRRNRRGVTSPPLVCIESNPGPKRKATRRVAKQPCHRRRKPKLDDVTKGKIAMGIDNDLSREEIRRQLDIGKGTVQMWADRYEETKELERKPGSGRPRVTTPSDDQYLILQCKRNRRRTAVELRRTITTEDKEPKASVHTIRRRLVEGGYPARKARKKPLLNKKQKKGRLIWAKDHRHWTVEQWRKVLWSDESPFTLFPRSGHRYVRRQPGEEMMEQCLEKTVKHGGGKIMVWGCFHANGVGILRKIEGTMDQNQYHTILCHAVIPEIKKLTNEEPNDVIWIFQHDNDPKHTAKKNERYLETKQGEGQLKFHVMPWPSQSPDLNPIENLWNIIKDALDDRIDRPSNLDELFQFVKEEWEKVPKDYLRNLVDNLPRRIQDVIKNKGGSTRY